MGHCFSCVIRGRQHMIMFEKSARILMQLSLEGLALGYGILTCENYDQALVRSVSSENNGKGGCERHV